jgi:predicted adenine nucleotide alpha hydrolase (AANH) superfamily ATPase
LRIEASNRVAMAKMFERVKNENNEYQQEYCGCVYSLRDTNRWRVSRGREKVERGVKFYAEAMDSLAKQC